MPIGFISSCWLLLAVLGTKVAVSAADVRMLEDVFRHPTDEGWVQAAPALGHETLRVRFALKQKNLEQLESILQKVSDPRNPAYGQYLSHENLNELVRPDDQTYSMVGTFLKGRGIQHYASLGNGDTIMVETTAATASRMPSQDFHSVLGKTRAPSPHGPRRSTLNAPRGFSTGSRTASTLKTIATVGRPSR
mmetsp:Transcript_14079/g.52849  ORF Transcript_14079/g.52849 Transcript_14079/m.52849 type:complete len:192 (-) Transcript_14079:1275-1850(-)